MKKWKSIAEWEPCHGFENNTTTDTHYTKEQAESVCRMLERDGLGGERCHFPLKTRVEEIEESPAKAEDASNFVQHSNGAEPAEITPPSACRFCVNKDSSCARSGVLSCESYKSA